MKHILHDYELKASLKHVRRALRFCLVSTIAAFISSRPVSSMEKMKKLIIALAPLFFSREINRARELLPDEFKINTDRIIRKMTENQIMNILEVFLYEKLVDANPDYVRISGIEILEECRQNRQGAIILGAHFGNWEMIAYAIAAKGYPIHVIARPQAHNRMNEFMNGFRESRGVKVLMDDNLSASLKLLKEGGVVGIVSDLNARERGYRVPFFGRDASFYPSPVILSIRGKAPLIPTFIERQNDGTHKIRLEQPVEWLDHETMTQRVSRYVKRYEAAIRRCPDHWVWFHERYRHAELGKS